MPLRDGDPSRIGRYRLTARLGAGGMGVVYLGTAKDGSQVAVKVLRPELADNGEFRTRFRREAATLEKVRGICTVRVVEADTESPRPFLVTEYAEGPSLAEWIGGHGAFPAQMLYGLATGLAEALVAIHAAGIVHRDLKPSNVLLTATGPKVIDFGIAQALDATVLTGTGMTIGSPGFMAPEQIMGQAGQPADVFAWGVTVAYAATGQSPFGAGPSDAILYRVLHESPDVSGTSPEIRPLVEKALAKDPAARPLASDLLRHLATGLDPRADPSLGPTQAVLARTWLVPAGRLLPGAAVAAARPWRPRRRFLTAVIGVAAVAVLTGAGLGFLARPSAKQAASVVTTQPPSQSRSSAAPASHPASPSQSASAASRTPTAQALGGISKGTQNCAFNTEDGTELASVNVTNTVCRDLAAALAADGHYWWPVDYQSPTTAYQNGGTGMSQACSMSADGMALAVYDMPTNAPTQTLAGVATSVCQKEEAAGWLPS